MQCFQLSYLLPSSSRVSRSMDLTFSILFCYCNPDSPKPFYARTYPVFLVSVNISIWIDHRDDVHVVIVKQPFAFAVDQLQNKKKNTKTHKTKQTNKQKTHKTLINKLSGNEHERYIIRAIRKNNNV